MFIPNRYAQGVGPRIEPLRSRKVSSLIRDTTERTTWSRRCYPASSFFSMECPGHDHERHHHRHVKKGVPIVLCERLRHALMLVARRTLPRIAGHGERMFTTKKKTRVRPSRECVAG